MELPYFRALACLRFFLTLRGAPSAPQSIVSGSSHIRALGGMPCPLTSKKNGLNWDETWTICFEQ
eukprot:1638188-Amphidinium_carterae.1